MHLFHDNICIKLYTNQETKTCIIEGFRFDLL